MPQRRAINKSANSVARLQAGRIIGPNHSDHQGVPVHGCVVGRCEAPIMDGSPTPLCTKHVRETYEFAQGIVQDRLLIAAASIAE